MWDHILDVVLSTYKQDNSKFENILKTIENIPRKS